MFPARCVDRMTRYPATIGGSGVIPLSASFAHTWHVPGKSTVGTHIGWMVSISANKSFAQL